MTVAKVWDPATSSWVTMATGPTIAQFNALEGRVDVLEAYKGRLVDVQSLKGNGGGALTTATSLATLKYRKNAAYFDMQIVYTPSQDVWWEVATNIGYLEKTDAAYADAFAQLTISPNDVIAGQDTESVNSTHYQAVTQHSTVDSRVLRNPTATWALTAGVTYTAKVFASFSAGTWRYFPGYNSMVGKAWTR